jgi:inorganic pyrophosphatase
MIDQGKEDEKLLAVGTNNPIYRDIKDYEQLYPHLLLEIEHFFTVYKELEAKSTRVVGWQNAEAARSVVMDCKERFGKNAGKG